MQRAQISRKRATVVLALGGYVNTGILIIQSLLLIPLYLHYIGAHLYGLWMATGGILAMLGMLNFGISNILVQRVANAYGQQDLSKSAAYFINGLLVYLIVILIFTVVGFSLSFFLKILFGMTEEFNAQLRGCFQLAVVAAGAGIFNECLRGFAQALLRPVFSIVAIALSRIMGIAITILLLFEDAGLWAIPVGMLVAEGLNLIAGLIQTTSLFRELRAKISIDKTIIRDYIEVGGSTFVAKLGSVLSRESDPILITLLLRPELTTAYMVTRRAADVVFQLLAVIYGAVHSAFSHLVGCRDAKKIAEVVTRLLFMVFFFGIVGFVSYVALNHSFVKLWVGESFVLDRWSIIAIGVAFFAGSMRNIIWQLLNGFGDYEYSSRVIFLEGTGKITLAIMLLSMFGMPGLPFAMVVSSIISVIALFVKLQSRVNFLSGSIELAYAIATTVSLFILGGFYSGIFSPSSWGGFVLFAGGVIIFASAVCALSNWHSFRSLIKFYPR